MAKFTLPEFARAIANAFVKVVDERLMKLLAKSGDLLAAVKGLANVNMSMNSPAPIPVRTGMPLAPPNRGSGQGR